MITKTIYVTMYKGKPYQFRDIRLFGILIFRTRHEYIL